jgi:NAD(P)H-hydrate repair Nnr-like enzyme with NAD(P)H-hydrate dehydratase domain
MEGTPFGGGTGNETRIDPSPEVTEKKDALINLLNNAAIRRYLVDPDGLKIALVINPDGTLTLTPNGGETLTFGYTRL